MKTYTEWINIYSSKWSKQKHLKKIKITVSNKENKKLISKFDKRFYKKVFRKKIYKHKLK